MNRRLAFLLSVALLTVFTVIGVYGGFFAPSEEAYSEKENRTLAGRPAFTLPGWLSGDYSDALETYLLDRFAGRDTIVAFTQKLQDAASLAGYDDLMAYKLAFGDERAGIDPSLLEMPDEPVYPSPAAPTPTAPPADTPDPTLTPAGMTPAPTRPPLPEKTTLQLTDIEPSVGIYLERTSGAKKLRSFKRSVLPDIVETLDAYAALLPENGRLIATTIPISPYGSALLRTDDALGLSSNIDKALEALSGPHVRCVDATKILGDAALAGEYVFFRTDNHCTPYGTYLWYCALCEAAGYEPTPLSAFSKTVEDPFLGTFYRDDPSAELRDNADTLEKYLPPQQLEYRRYVSENEYELRELFDENANKSDRYTVYLGGTGGAWNTMVNLSMESGDNCLVVSDSFGPVAVLMLSGQYKEVHFVDPRYYRADTMGGPIAKQIARFNITDCFFITSVNFALSEDSYIKIAGRRLY